MPALCMLMLYHALMPFARAADLQTASFEPRFKLPPEVATDVVPLRWLPQAVMVKVTINGADAGWFELSTGHNESFIDPAVAAKLKLPEIPEFGPVTRDIQKTTTKPGVWGSANYFRADTVQCGSAVASDVRFFAMRPPSSAAEGSESSMSSITEVPDGEPVAGVLGWDLLRTLPFLLDTPGLQLVWQRQANPPAGATRLPLIEIRGYPCVDITVGGVVQVRALVATFGAGFSIDAGVIKRDLATLWQNARHGYGADSDVPIKADDDALPFDHKLRDEPYSTRWLEVSYGDCKQTLDITPEHNRTSAPADARLGSKALRRTLALFDGPGGALWLIPAATAPEITLVGKDRPKPSPALMKLAVMSAIRNDDSDAIEALLASGADANEPDVIGPLFAADVTRTLVGSTPLQLACRTGSGKVVASLLEAGARVDPIDERMLSPLIFACESANPDIIRLLIRKGANPNRSVGPMAPLPQAVCSGSSAAVEALGPKVRYPTQPRWIFGLAGQAAQGGNHPLFLKWVAKLPESALDSVDWPQSLEALLLGGHEETVAWVLKQQGADVVRKPSAIPPLIAAIMPTRIGKTDAVREKLVAMLLAAGADPNASCKGVTPLLLAARHGNISIIDQLLAAGAKVSAKDYKQRNALMRAACADQPAALIERLLKAGIDPNDVDSDLEMTPLAVCAASGNADACRVLLKAGAAPDGDSMMVLTPLTAALNPGNSSDPEAVSDAVKVLLDHGAKVPAFGPANPFTGMVLHTSISASRGGLIKDLAAARQPPLDPDSKEARDCLARACLTADPATVRAVLDLGVKPTSLDSNGISPLSNAASSGMVRNMKLLLDLGVPPDASAPSDVPAIWMAASYGQVNAVRLLLAVGARPDAEHPEKKTTAMEVARARGDGTVISLLEKTPALTDPVVQSPQEPAAESASGMPP
jgi:ankyrin repeat protein